MNPSQSKREKKRSWRSRGQKNSVAMSAEALPLQATTPTRKGWRGVPETRTDFQHILLWASRLLITTAVVAIVAFLLQIFLTLHRPVPIVTAIASTYRPPFGPLPLTGEDRELIKQLGRPGNSFFTPMAARVHDVSNFFTEAATGQELLPYITRAFETIRPGGPHRDTVIFYITAVGAVTAEGMPCLIPPSTVTDPINLQDDDYLPVDRLFAAVQAAIGTDVNAVVVLDCGRNEQGWPYGLDVGAFPSAVEKLFQRTDHERLWVLLPASTGQQALGSPWQGGSNFAIHFTRGLRGAADITPWGNGDGKVALQELATYLRDRVDNWASTIFGVRQTPVLLTPSLNSATESRNPTTVFLGWSGSPPQTLPTALPPAADERWLKDRWRTADSIRSRFSNDRPVRWATYQSLLLRTERLFRSGRDTEILQGETAALVEQFESVLRLPLTALQFVLPDERLANRMPQQDHSSSGPTTETDFDRVLRDPKVTIGPPLTDLNAWQTRVEQGWAWLCEQLKIKGGMNRKTAERWAQYIGPSPAGQSFTPVQLHFVKMLLDWTAPSAWEHDAKHFSDLIRAIEASRKIALGWSLRLDRSPLNAKQFGHANDVFRRAVDLTFAGTDESMAESRQLVAQAISDFADIEDRLVKQDKAIRTLDRLNSDLPYLFAWWSHERSAEYGSQEQSLPEPDQIAELLAITRRYDRNFRRLTTIPSLAERESKEETKLLYQQQQQAGTAYRRLKDAYLLHCEELSRTAADGPKTLGAIRRALTTPLIPAELRLSLIRRAATLESRLTAQYAANPHSESATLPPLKPEAVLAGTVTVAGVRAFPVTRLFSAEQLVHAAPNTSMLEIPRFAGQQAAAVRNIARGFPNFLASVRREAAESDDRGTLDTDAWLSILEQASSVIHRLAPLVGESPHFTEEADPEVPYLANLCHRRMLSLTELALDDFWAALQHNSRPYCLEKAHRLLELARFIRKNYGTRIGELVQQKLDDRLGSLDANAERFAELSLKPNQITLAPADFGESTQGSVHLTPKPGVPEGLGAIWLAAGLDSPPLEAINLPSSTRPIGRLPIAVSPHSQATPWSLDRRISQRLEDQQIPALDFVSWFRGHRMADAIKVAPARAARTTRWHSESTKPTSVTVHGEVTQVRAVAIVFDCSGSMGQRMADGRTRLDAGRAAVAQLLNDLVTAGNWDVSLWLYGHRTQWSRDNRGRYSFKLTHLGEKAKTEAAKSEQPFNLVPGDDVEQVLPMQALTPGVVREIETVLTPLSPGGETPLYRAISEAIGTDFDGPHRSIPGHVLVVTDGANDQSGGQLVTASGVADQLARKNLRRPNPLRIDIIGYALEADAMQRALRMGEARDLAVRSGGEFYEAADPTALAISLRQSLQLLRWQISGRHFRDKSFQLGDSVNLPVAPPDRLTNYDITLEVGSVPTSRRVAAENNASLDLFVAGAGRSLEFRRYDGGTEQGIRDSLSGLIDPLDPRRQVFLGAHLATRSGDEVRFPVSVQNDDSRSYSQRPTDVWFEVYPLVRDKPTGRPYVFYDKQLQPGRSVPVFDLATPNWPRNAKAAAIKAWVRFDQLRPDIAIDLHGIPSEKETELNFPGLPDSTFHVHKTASPTPELLEITVTEQHPSELASQLPLLRVQIPHGCTEAVHTVEPDSGRVRHKFLVAADTDQAFPPALLELTDRQRITSGAISTTLSAASQLIVPIPAE